MAGTGTAALLSAPVLWGALGWKLGALTLGLGLACGLYLLLGDSSIVTEWPKSPRR